MTSMTPFFGRKDEVAALTDALGDPQGKAILVVGPQGMGKSTLIERFLQLAESGELTPTRPCVTMSFRLTRDEEALFFLGRMLFDIEQAIQGKAEFFSVTPRGRTQLRALFDLVPKAQQLRDLFTSLRNRQDRHPRDEFIEYLTTLSDLLPDDARAIVAIDANKQLHDASDDTWRVIVERLPDKVVMVFGQRPDDVLAVSSELLGLPNVLRIPRDDLHSLSGDEVDAFIAWGVKETGIEEATLTPALQRYAGHPYAISAAVDLLRDGVPLDALPPDPTPADIAEAQWRRVKDRPDGRNAIRLFKAHAVLDVPVPAVVAGDVSGVDDDQQEALLANRFIASLLRETGGARAVYHAILRDHIMAQLDVNEACEYHERATKVYRDMLAEARRTQTAPDPLACSQAFVHAGKASGTDEAIRVFVDECTPPLVQLGLLDVVSSTTEQFLKHNPPDSAAHAALLNNLGVVMRTRGNFEGAEKVHRQVLEVSRKMGWLEGMASSYGNLGLIMQSRGNLDGAEKMLRQALEIEEKLDRLEGMASDYGNLGIIMRILGDLDGAEKMLRRSLEINEKLRRLEGVANQYGNLGNVMQSRGDLDGAEKMFRRALEISKKLDWVEGMANQYGNLGLIMQSKGNLDGAETMFRKALEIEKKLGRLEGMASDYGNLGRIMLDRQHVAEARKLWIASRDLFQQMGAKDRAASVQAWLNDLPL